MPGANHRLTISTVRFVALSVLTALAAVAPVGAVNPTVGWTGAAWAAPSHAGRINSLETKVTTLAIAERAKVGCRKSLRPDPKLRAAARGHSADMARRDYFGHNGASGSMPWDRAEAAGYRRPVSENLAKGQPTARAVMRDWMRSPVHRANILDCSARAIGVGLAYDSGTPVWTQLFGAA